MKFPIQFFPSALIRFVCVATAFGAFSMMSPSVAAAAGLDADWSLLGGEAYSETDPVSGVETVTVVPSVPAGGVELELDEGVLESKMLYSFYLKAPAQDAELAQTTFDLAGAEVALVREGAINRVYTFDALGAKKGEWVPTDYFFESLSDEEWIEVTLVQDKKKRLWDLYLDGDLAAAGVTSSPLLKRIRRFALYGAETQDTKLSDFSEKPYEVVDPVMFVSRFASGTMGFRLEEMSALYGDRLVHYGGQMQSLKAVFAEQMALLGDAFLMGPDEGLIFVNNAIGSDSYDGQSIDVSDTSGPKATITAAFAAAPEGAFVVIFEGTGIYPEKRPDRGGKRMTTLFLGNGISGDLGSIKTAFKEKRVKMNSKRQAALQALGVRM